MKNVYNNTFSLLLLIVLLAACSFEVKAQNLPKQQTSLMQYIIQERPLLADLITKAGLAPMLSGDKPITLLAPPESDLQNIKEESAGKLKALLSNHLLEGSYKEIDLKDGATLKTIGGAGVTICRKQNYTLVNGARIVQPDLQLKNGTLHGVGSLIRP